MSEEQYAEYDAGDASICSECNEIVDVYKFHPDCCLHEKFETSGGTWCDQCGTDHWFHGNTEDIAPPMARYPGDDGGRFGWGKA